EAAGRPGGRTGAVDGDLRRLAAVVDDEGQRRQRRPVEAAGEVSGVSVEDRAELGGGPLLVDAVGAGGSHQSGQGQENQGGTHTRALSIHRAKFPPARSIGYDERRRSQVATRSAT